MPKPAKSRPTAPEIVAGGPVSLNNVDRDRRDGRRGDGSALESAVLLFPFASTLTLQDTDLNNLTQNQVQRIDTAHDRATQEQRRATPQASDAFHLASGDQGHHERRKPSRFDSAQGSKQGSVASLVGRSAGPPFTERERSNPGRDAHRFARRDHGRRDGA